MLSTDMSPGLPNQYAAWGVTAMLSPMGKS
jgi:hypothetical protein